MPLASSCYGSTFRLCVTSASWSGHGLFANKRYVLPSPWVTRDVLYAQRWIMYFPKLCTKTLPAYPELALFRVNPGSTTTPNRFPLTLSGVVFVLQRWRRSFSLSFGKPHTNTLSHARVFVKVVKNTAPLSVCLCVCSLCPRGGKFHFSLAFSSLLVWGGAQELGSRLHDVCSTRSRRRRWSVVVAVIWYRLGLVGTGKIRFFPLPATVNPGAVFCFHYSTLYGYNFYNFGFSTAAGGRHICNICRSSLKLFSSFFIFVCNFSLSWSWETTLVFFLLGRFLVTWL